MGLRKQPTLGLRKLLTLGLRKPFTLGLRKEAAHPGFEIATHHEGNV
jgi:hypothetical protein